MHAFAFSPSALQSKLDQLKSLAEGNFVDNFIKEFVPKDLEVPHTRDTVDAPSTRPAPNFSYSYPPASIWSATCQLATLRKCPFGEYSEVSRAANTPEQVYRAMYGHSSPYV